MLTLELLICTIDEGITKIPSLLLPPERGVGYLVSWQQSGNVAHLLPAELAERADVRVVCLQGKGLSANRNNALHHATGDILLLSDDDTRYRLDYFKRIVAAFEDNPAADIITFRAINEDQTLIRPYPEHTYTYDKRPYGSYVCSCEIALRHNRALPAFDERFGLGSSYLACGEEEVFIHDAFKQGLQILYLPKIVVQTDSHTTGTLFPTSAAVQRSKGAVLYVMHGFGGALLRCLKFALTLRSYNRLRIFINLYRGIKYAQRTRP